MKKSWLNIILLGLFGYVLLFKFVFITYGEVFSYIINPTVWLLFAVIVYFSLKKEAINRRKYQTEVIKITIISSLLYIITFYLIGTITNYTKNPYSTTITGIFINLFSILLVATLKEYLRGGLVNFAINNHYRRYLIIIFFLFFLTDINLLSLVNSFNSLNKILDLIVRELVPFAIVNLFLIYLCYQGGYIAAIIYQSIILFPSLIIGVFPKYDQVIIDIYNIVFPLFTFIIIRSSITKKEKQLPVRLLKQFNPRRWFLTFFLAVFIVLFGLGVFPIKPIVIITGSMEPYIHPGDMLIIMKCKIEDVQVGDIIQYKMNDYTVVHRVAQKYNRNNTNYLILKGDNNVNVDKEPVTSKQIIGKLKYKIPYVGYPTYILNKIFGDNQVEVETGAD